MYMYIYVRSLPYYCKRALWVEVAGWLAGWNYIYIYICIYMQHIYIRTVSEPSGWLAAWLVAIIHVKIAFIIARKEIIQ